MAKRKPPPKPEPQPAETKNPDEPTYHRHNSYTRELADLILARHAAGETVTAICRDLKVGIETPLRWARDIPTFTRGFVRAREMFADAKFDEALEIAEQKIVVKLPPDKAGVEKVDRAASRTEAQWARLKIDTIFRVVSKINPAKYGDRLNLHHSGSIAFEGVTDDRLNARIVKDLTDLGVLDQLRAWDLTEEQLAQFVALFQVTELPASDAQLLLPAPREEIT